MIRLVDVWYTYPNGARALRGVSLELGEGVTVIVGPNGSGKTTLLKVAACLYRPQRGSVLVDGADYWRLSEEERLAVRRRVVYVHERPIMLRGSVLNNVAYGLRIRGMPRAEAERRALEALEELNAAHLACRKARELSSGEAQLVSIARALALSPRYLLLDEPTAFVDSSRRRALIEVVRRLAEEGVCIAVASHDYLLAIEIADRVVTMEEGMIRYVGGVEELRRELALGVAQLPPLSL